MKVSRRFRRYLLTVIIIPILFLVVKYYSDIQLPFKISHSWTLNSSSIIECKGADRELSCQLELFCISKSIPQGFTVGLNHSLPPINILSVDHAKWITFANEEVIPPDAMFDESTLVVYGTYSPYHMSHFFWNNLLPLYETLGEYSLSRHETSLLQLPGFDSDRIHGNFPFDYSFMAKAEYVIHDLLSEAIPVSTNTSMPRRMQTYLVSELSQPICFKRAILGIGARCTFSYCARISNAESTRKFKKDVFDYLTSTTDSSENADKLATNSELNKDETSCRKWDMGTLHNDSFQPPVHHHEKIYTVTAENRSSPLDFKGEWLSAPIPKRAKGVHIGLLNRFSTRNVVNMYEFGTYLEQYLPAAFPDTNFYIHYLNFESSKFPFHMQTPLLMRQLDILISPHGNNLGAALFMDECSMVLSINSRFSGGDWWFGNPLLNAGIRFYSYECTSDECTNVDWPAARISAKIEDLRLPPRRVADSGEADYSSKLVSSKMDPNVSLLDSIWDHPEFSTLFENFRNADLTIEQLLGSEQERNSKYLSEDVATFKNKLINMNARYIKQQSQRIIFHEVFQIVRLGLKDMLEIASGSKAVDYDELCKKGKCCSAQGRCKGYWDWSRGSSMLANGTLIVEKEYGGDWSIQKLD